MDEPIRTPEQQTAEARRLQRLAEKKKRKLQQRAVLAVLLVIAVLAFVLIFRGYRDAGGKTEAARPEQIDSAETITTEPDTVVSIAAVGDIMIYDDMIEDALQDTGIYDFTENLSAVSGLTVSADLTVGNLELNFCGEPYGGEPDQRAPTELASVLSSVGFDILQTANTYSIQNGLSGLQSTVKALNTVGISALGTYASPEERAKNSGVLLKNVNGVKVAFLAFTKGFGGLSLPAGSEYAANVLYEDYASDYSKINEDDLLGAVNAAKALEPDIIIAMLHWGSDPDINITETQSKITKLLLENGVDAILGSHPHIVGKMEERTVTTVDGENKNCFVAYSLGNFFSTMEEAYALHCRESVVLNLQFTKSGQTGETTISGISYTPICLMDNGEDTEPRFEVLPIRSAITSDLFPERKQDLTDAIAHLRSATQSDYDSGK